MKEIHDARARVARAPSWASPIRDAKEAPRYSIAEAARYLQIPSATLSSWFAGRQYPVVGGTKDFSPLIDRPDKSDPRLSFANLIEAHALRALRCRYQVPMRAIRTALDYAESESGIRRLLLSDELRAMPGEVFLQRLDGIVNIGRGGQHAIKGILEMFLQRIDRDGHGAPLRLFPFTRPPEQIADRESPRLVLIDPQIASGRPILSSKAIRTATVADRFTAGESISELASDYGLTAPEIEEAIRYERPKQIAA